MEPALNQNDKARRVLEIALDKRESMAADLGKVGTTPAFAAEVATLRGKLARPIRWGAAILCSAVLGLGTGGLAYSGAKLQRENVAAATHKVNRGNYSGPKLEVPSTTPSDEKVELAVGLGLLGLAAGGLGGYGVGSRPEIEGWAAQRKARKIVKRAQASQ